MKFIKKNEDTLKVLALRIIQGRNAEDRFAADSQFTRSFVRALKITNSFNYPFDSLFTISKVLAPDNSFRIFTWQMVINENVIRQHGAIQMHTPDGSLKLFPLIDRSDVTLNMDDTIGNNLGWIGAIYYKIIQKEAFGKQYYTLLGYDENNIRSNKKVIEVLTFNNGQPIFGGAYFSFPNSSFTKRSVARYVMEFKKNASPRLTYDPDQDMIIYEHLIPEPGVGQVEKKYTYVPDGDYEGLKWRDGRWIHIDKVFTFKLKDGESPLPNPVRNDKGEIDESKLKDNSKEGDNDTQVTEDSKQDKLPVKEKIVKKKTTRKKSVHSTKA